MALHHRTRTTGYGRASLSSAPDALDESLNHYLSFLTARLTGPRLRHSLGVMRVMGELAPLYSLDRFQARSAGLLHDVARDISHGEQLDLALRARIEFRHPCERHPVYLHALLGAYVAATELDVTDRAVLDAIAAHSYADLGARFSAPLSHCLRFADLLAPIHPWPGMVRLRELVYAQRVDEATLLQCHWLIEYFEEQGIPVHPHLASEYQVLARKMAVPESFFARW